MHAVWVPLDSLVIYDTPARDMSSGGFMDHARNPGPPKASRRGPVQVRARLRAQQASAIIGYWHLYGAISKLQVRRRGWRLFVDIGGVMYLAFVLPGIGHRPPKP